MRPRWSRRLSSKSRQGGPDGHRIAELPSGTSPPRPPPAPLDEGRRPERGRRRRRPLHGHRRRRARRAHGGLRVDQAWGVVRRPGGRGHPRRRDQPDRLSTKGYRFDIGGHRFFSKSEEINDLWREILGDQFITRKRMSRIYYNRTVLPLPAQAGRRLPQARPDPLGPDPAQLHSQPARPDRSRAELRGLDRQPLRPAPVRHVLQDLHREGLGDVHRGNLRRLGRAADQRALT